MSVICVQGNPAMQSAMPLPFNPVATNMRKQGRPMNVNSLIQDLEEFRDVSSDITVLSVLTLLYIGRRGVCVQKDIERELRVSNAAASRNINYWSKTGKLGLDYVYRYEDANDRRINMLRLTQAGQAFYDKITRENSNAA